MKLCLSFIVDIHTSDSCMHHLNTYMQVTVAAVSMKAIVGLMPTLTAFSSIVLVVPIATIFGTAVDRVRKWLITRTDARVNLMSEIIASELIHLLNTSNRYKNHPSISVRASAKYALVSPGLFLLMAALI
jgi:hypothetical protein